MAGTRKMQLEMSSAFHMRLKKIQLAIEEKNGTRSSLAKSLIFCAENGMKSVEKDLGLTSK